MSEIFLKLVMNLSKTVSIKLDNEMWDYILSQSNDDTLKGGIVKIVNDHITKQFDADIEDGLSFLAKWFRTIEFREDIIVNAGLR